MRKRRSSLALGGLAAPCARRIGQAPGTRHLRQAQLGIGRIL
jgi:hypothetical protein